MQEKLDSTIGLKCEAALQKCEEHKNRSESALTDSIDALKRVARLQKQKTLFDPSVLLPPPLPNEKRTHQPQKAESFDRTEPNTQTLPFCDLSEAGGQKLYESDKTPVLATQILNKTREALRTSNRASPSVCRTIFARILHLLPCVFTPTSTMTEQKSPYITARKTQHGRSRSTW